MSRFVRKARAPRARPVVVHDSSDDEEVAQGVGENGTLEYTTKQVGDARVALFFALVRGIAPARVNELTKACLEQGEQNRDEMANVVADLFVMAFQSRDCRGGKGERAMFYAFLAYMFREYPTTTFATLALISEYGYYKDFFQLIAFLETLPDKDAYVPLQQRILDIVANQLIADEAAVDGGNNSISLCAKYAPREGHSFHEKHKDWFKALLERLFPTSTTKEYKPQYRRLITKLTKALNVVEVKMCEQSFAAIDFEHVPALCAKKYRKAFLNEKLKAIPTPDEFETGNRHPEDEDRVSCRKRLIAQVMEKEGVKGKQLFPHEITKVFMSGAKATSTIEQQMLQTQWQDMKAGVVAKLQEKREKGDAKQVDLGKLVPLVDVSGSMGGTPMEVAIALGILVSEINHPAFRNRFITFESIPQWVNLESCRTLADKVKQTQRAPWGGSTNIEKAFELIEQAVKQHKLAAEEIPDMLILSDMQFDQAAGGKAQTQLQRIKERFAKLGKEISGEPYPAPRIVFWNLRGDTSGFPAKSDSENVQMLSGFSPSLFKFIVEGEEMVEEEVEEDVVVVNADGTTTTTTITTTKMKKDPYLTLRKVLDDERYFPLRMLLSNSNEKALRNYTFVAPVKEESEEPTPAEAASKGNKNKKQKK